MKNFRLNKIRLIFQYSFYLIILIVFSDIFIFHNLLGYGYPRHYEEENVERYPSPYVEFIGKPNTDNHNEFGFLGPSFNKSKPDDLKIAFFGGSTGYEGNPPIPVIVESKLKKLLGISVFVANYSVVSSNHRQHLHAIIEFLPPFKPDIVIFYGGYNETIQSAKFDPRPGYPYNYFYRAETGPFSKILLENSAIIGEIDKRLGIFTGLSKLQKEQAPYTDSWDKRIVDKYFETLMLAKKVSGLIESKKFGKTRFYAFYQPYQVPRVFLSAHNEIRKRISRMNYIFDVSSEYDDLGKGVYVDQVHVHQGANELMGTKIAEIIARQLNEGIVKAPLGLKQQR